MESIAAQSNEITRSTQEQNSTISEVSKALDNLTAIMHGVVMSADSLIDVFNTLQTRIQHLHEISSSEDISTTEEDS